MLQYIIPHYGELEQKDTCDTLLTHNQNVILHAKAQQSYRVKKHVLLIINEKHMQADSTMNCFTYYC